MPIQPPGKSSEEKSFTMLLSRRNEVQNHLDETTLETKLGGCIDNQLSWINREMVGHVLLLKFSPGAHKKLLSSALVLPIIKYCPVVWDRTTVIVKISIQKYTTDLILNKLHVRTGRGNSSGKKTEH